MKQLSFWQWTGIVVVILIVGGIILKYRAVSAIADIEKAKINKSDTINYLQTGD